MGTKRKSPSDAGTSRGDKTRQNQHAMASSRRDNSTTSKPIQHQLTLQFTERMPRPADVARFKNQRTDVVAWLFDGKSLTQDSARYLFQIMRLASRISELRKAGCNITRRMIEPSEGAARIAEYSLDLSCPRAEGVRE